MTGASYGGIIQYSTAALDRRVDAIAPAYTAYSLSSTTMSSYGKFKEGWGLLLGAISTTTIPPGLTSPLGPQVHAPDPQTVLGLAASTSTGELTSAFREYLDRRSPSTFLDRVDVPTLITGGTSDTLFPLINAVTDYRILKARHVPVAMMWNCEGHSVCPGQSGPLEKHFDTTQVRWFQRWLFRDSSVRTGPGFTWIADNENSYRSAPSFPVAPVTYLTGSGSGRLVLSPLGPLQSLGVPEVGAKPGVGGVDVPIGPPRRVGNVVGFPRLSLSYRGTALPARSWIYAQVVDRGTGRVVGGQVTPVPVVLDGRERSVVVNLNAITSRATLASRYVLQLLPGSLVFGLQRSSGLLRLINVGVRLPVAP